jgi:hypothetical protein
MKKNKVSIILFIVLGVIALYIFITRDPSVSSEALKEFAIEDTASINKLFFADNDGNQSLLEKQADGTWIVNGKYVAKPQNVFLILRGLRNFEVKSTVPEEAVPAILKQIASKPIKLEVFQGGKKPTKIYYFGFATQDHYGNYALLEIPGEGKSSEPFIIKENGFYGFIRPRLITQEDEWRSTEVFMYPKLEIKNIKVDYPEIQDQSFEIEWLGKNNLKLRDLSGKSYTRFDTLEVKNYMLNYKALYAETFNNRLTEAQVDSVVSQTSPKAILTIIDKNDQVNTIRLYTKGFVDPFLRDEENMNVDPERIYLLNQQNELAIAQRLQWDPLLIPLNSFITE